MDQDARLAVVETDIAYIKKQQEQIVKTQEKIEEKLSDLVTVWNQAKAVRWVLGASIVVGGLFITIGEKIHHFWKVLAG